MKKFYVRITFMVFLAMAMSEYVRCQQAPFPLPAGYSSDMDVVYSRVDSLEMKLDIYYMKQSSAPLPLIIWIHGGGWRSGDKKSARFARELLGKGYAVASINYRLSGTAVFPAQIIDCKSAVRWLRANASYYNIDPQRFAAWGGSAGSHLAALLGTAEDMPEWGKGSLTGFSSRVQAVIDWFGPTDFSRMDDVPGKMVHLEAGSPESVLLGCAVGKNPDKVAYANPVTYVNRYNPPFQIYHGKNDSLVIPGQAVLLNRAFIKCGLHPDFALLDSTAHGGREWNNYIPRAKAFLDSVFIDQPSKAKPQPSEPAKRWVYQYFKIERQLTYDKFYSKSAGGEYSCLVYLPPSYIHSTERRYPVIYWLPGRGGNPSGVGHFAELYDRAINNRLAPEAIIVGVNGINSSMYTDDKEGKFPIASVIVNDLVKHVDETYRTIPLREMRALDGFSMGGYGAAKLGFQHPDIFGVVSIVGAAIHTPGQLQHDRPEIFRDVFMDDPEYCRQRSPWTIAANNRTAVSGNMFIRLYIGQADRQLLKKNMKFHQYLVKQGIVHDFGIIPAAGHNYTQVYTNWPGNPFDFYMKAFGVPLSKPDYERVRAKDRPEPDYRDLSYGPFKKNRFDLWLAGSGKNTPLMIFIHGGGFRQGDKSIVYNHELNELLHAGISVASINYRLLGDDPLPAAFLDGKRALQYIRMNAQKWNIDPHKIAVYGGSAGAQISMWLACHDEMADPGSQDPVERESTRVSFCGSKGGQLTMDLKWWEKWIPAYVSGKGREPSFGTPGMSQEKISALCREYSTIEHVSFGDPPIYAYYKMKPDDPVPLVKSEIGSWQAHNIIFGIRLKDMADSECVYMNLNYPGAAVPFKSIVDFAGKCFSEPDAGISERSGSRSVSISMSEK